MIGQTEPPSLSEEPRELLLWLTIEYVSKNPDQKRMVRLLQNAQNGRGLIKSRRGLNFSQCYNVQGTDSWDYLQEILHPPLSLVRIMASLSARALIRRLLDSKKVKSVSYVHGRMLLQCTAAGLDFCSWSWVAAFLLSIAATSFSGIVYLDQMPFVHSGDLGGVQN